MKYYRKEIVEILTWDEFIDLARHEIDNLKLWPGSFNINNTTFILKKPEFYLMENSETHMAPGMVLVIKEDGSMYPLDEGIFKNKFKKDE